MKGIEEHRSYNSFSNDSEAFKLMFPDSEVAQKYKVGKTKASYFTNHGLKPHFHHELLGKLERCPYISVYFDEAMNRIAQKTQMDIFVRYIQIQTTLTFHVQDVYSTF